MLYDVIYLYNFFKQKNIDIKTYIVLIEYYK